MDPNAPDPVKAGDARFHGPTRTILILIIILACGTLVGFGVQQAAYQHQQRSRAACTERWGQSVVDTIAVRSDATSAVDQAQAQKDDALDGIIGVVIGLRKIPPASTPRDLDDALARFAEAKASLGRVKAAASQTRAENPYPRLDCR